LRWHDEFSARRKFILPYSGGRLAKKTPLIILLPLTT
jgi:hypothetical protein